MLPACVHSGNLRDPLVLEYQLQYLQTRGCQSAASVSIRIASSACCTPFYEYYTHLYTPASLSYAVQNHQHKSGSTSMLSYRKQKFFTAQPLSCCQPLCFCFSLIVLWHSALSCRNCLPSSLCALDSHIRLPIVLQLTGTYRHTARARTHTLKSQPAHVALTPTQPIPAKFRFICHCSNCLQQCVYLS